MIAVTLICVGKLKEKHFQTACEEYLKRLRPFAAVTVTELPEKPVETEAEIAPALDAEGNAIERAIPKNAFFIVLSPEGRQMPIEAFAARIDALASGGESRICFLIGGSNGICPRIKKQANLLLSMSEMTFPHHLARVMLLEQLYRAFAILNHRKYHK